MNKIYYLVKYEYDYADEFDVYGFELLDQDGIDKLNNRIENLTYPYESYFGTNEALLLENIEEIKYGLKIIKITYNDYISLEKLFGTRYGSFPYFEQ